MMVWRGIIAGLMLTVIILSAHSHGVAPAVAPSGQVAAR
jgi:hypothetical protein